MNKNILFKICLIGVLSLAGTTPSFADGPKKDTLDVDLGFGIIQTKKKTTAAAMSISNEELKQTAAINLKEALYGRLLGLTALKTGGFSGDRNYGASFNIRGLQTSSENHILILVDGLERPIDRLSVDEVESVTVLKDAAAVALYGYKGVNGAILVKTKQGTTDKRIVNVSYDHKFNYDLKTPKFVNAHTYVTALNEARINDGLSAAYGKYEVEAFENNSDPLYYPNVNWKEEAFKDTGHENQLNVDVRGGDDKVQYFAIVNYVDTRGMLNHTDGQDYSSQLRYSKANIRTNVSYKITTSTTMHVNAAVNFLENSRPSGIDRTQWAENKYVPDGLSANDLMYYLFATPASAYPVKTKDGYWGGNTNSIYGPRNIAALTQTTGRQKFHGKTYFFDTKLSQDLGMLIKGLSTSVRLGYDNHSEIGEVFYKNYKYGNDRYVYDNNGNVLQTVSYTAGDLAEKLDWGKWPAHQWQKTNFAFSLDYKTTLGDNNLQGSFIYSSEKNVSDNRYNTINRANWGGHFHYDLKNKYMADLSLMLSGSSRSYPQKFAFSPTLSLGWIISDEKFLENVNAVNFLKLRASGGILHTDYVPRTGLSFEDYSGGHGYYYYGASYSQQWGFFLGYLPTKNFKLERAFKYNLGLDATFLNAIDLTFDAYYQRRDNILQSTDGLNSVVIGIPSAYANKGIVDSKGIEIGLNYSKKLNDLTLNLGTMFTYGTNKVIDAVETPQAYDYLSKIGIPVRQNFGLEAIGFFKDQADIDASNVQEFSIVKPGDVKYKDQNGDNLINENDMVPIGYSSLVPEINYAFNLGAEYKGLGFNVLFQGVGNYTKQLDVIGVHRPLAGNVNLSEHYLENAWRAGADNSNAIYPRLTSVDSPNNYRPSSIWFANASFLKLRNCELYYKLPKSLLSKASISSAKLYVKGENLISFDSIKEIDPELTWAAYPTLKGINLGVALNF